MSNLHNELTKANRVSLAIRRMFGGEHELAVERLSETLQPVVNIWDHPWCQWLRDEIPFWGFKQAPSVALNLSWVAIQNPSAARRIITVESVSLRSSGAGQAWLGILPNASLVGTSWNLYKKDSRVGGGGSSQALPVTTITGQYGDSLAGVGANVAEALFTSTTEHRPVKNVPIVLHPGFSLFAELQVVNTSLDMNIAGNVRDCFPGELP